MQDIPATQAEKTLPRRSGGFELHRELGRGGMGVVYEAHELSSGRRVALKVLLADLTVSDEAFERFKREARIAASISDSRCVFVYGAHQIDGSPAIAMELVPGDTLEHRIARGEPIPIEKAVRWTIEILDGLEAASMAGVVHRDVKPSNCFVTDDDQIKVGDFGLARSLEADLRLTLSGQFLGSPLYASPEQIKGREIDLRSDLYSCAATLYALLTGRAPHSGTNLGEVLARILTEPPTPPRSLRPEIPRSLERVVQKAMDRDPRKRFQSHADMRAALQSFVSDSAVAGHPLRRVVAYLLDTSLIGVANAVGIRVLSTMGVDLIGPDPERPWLLHSLGLQAAMQMVPFVYFAAFEGALALTPGKWVCGLRVSSGRQGTARRAAFVLRAAIFLLPGAAFATALAGANVSKDLYAALAGLAPLLLTLGLFSTMRKRNGWRGVHEFLSGTRVVQRRTPFASLARSAPPDPAPLTPIAGMPSHIGAYVVEGAVETSTDRVVLQARDPNLDRTVWIVELDGDTLRVTDERRMLLRPGRVRWLDALAADGKRYEVFEAPGGASLLACARNGTSLSWPKIHRLLASLADELEAMGAERAALQHAWIDRSWNVRVLDARFGSDHEDAQCGRDLLVEAARRLLPERAVLPPDLPEYAEPTARRLFGMGEPFEVADARRALRELESRPLALTRRARATQIAFSVAPALLLALLFVAGLWLAIPALESSTESHSLAQDLERGTVIGVDATSANLDPVTRPLTDEERESREILIADWQRKLPHKLVRIDPSDAATRARFDHALSRHPDPSEDELAWARAHLGPTSPTDDDQPDLRPWLAAVPLFVVVLWGLFASLSALFWRGGISLSVFDLRLRDRRGRRASRWICLLRSSITWIPLTIVWALPWYLRHVAGTNAALLGALLALTVHVLVVAHALVRPERGLPDQVLGTRLVPS